MNFGKMIFDNGDKIVRIKNGIKGMIIQSHPALLNFYLVILENGVTVSFSDTEIELDTNYDRDDRLRELLDSDLN